MNKEIVLLTNEGRNCREDVIATAVNFLGNDYRLIFSEAWGFDLAKQSESGTLGDRLIADWGDLYQLSAQYNGIKVTDIQFESASQAYNTVYEKINSGGVIGFTMDAHWCPWTDFFQVKDVHVQGHTILGFDLTPNNEIICVDCLPKHYGVTVSYEYFLKGNNGKVILFEKDQSKMIDVNSEMIIKKALKKVRTKGLYGDTFSTIRAFSDAFQNIEYEKECKGYGKDDFWNSSLFLRILNFAGGRKQFGNVIKLLGKREGNEALIKIGDELQYIGTKWLGIRGCLIKARVAGLNSKWIKRITELLMYIADYEESIAEKLEQIVLNKPDMYSVEYEKKVKVDYAQESAKCIELLDIHEYLNNKGFDDVASVESKADITGTGDYLLANTMLKKDTISVGKVKYRMALHEISGMDNISCERQLIKMDNIKVKQVNILACAEWGSFYEKVDVVLSDGSLKESYFQLNDWCEKPSDTCYLEVEAAGIKNKELILDSAPRYISSVICSFDNEMEVTGIRLPDCPNIHIFSISFC